jgi:phosphoribosylglycinamide formyltransferase-1
VAQGVLNIAFMVSHGGTSMKAILTAISERSLRARACAAISNNGEAPALAVARSYGVPTYHLSQTKIGPAEDLDQAIVETLEKAEAEIVVLSGYLRRLGSKTLTHFRGRILNVHPSLLPKYGGRGMHGLHVHEAVIAAGERISGASVHLVEAEYDTGPVLAQRTVPVETGDTPAELASRIEKIEPQLFVDTLRAIADGRVDLSGY